MIRNESDNREAHHGESVLDLIKLVLKFLHSGNVFEVFECLGLLIFFFLRARRINQEMISTIDNTPEAGQTASYSSSQ